ncbi:Phage capsid family protein [compost metagenome]
MTGEVIEWVREKSFTNAAAAVAEGGVKPESTFEWETVTSTASTIAHWVQITRQALSDDSQISGYINGRLTYGLRRVLQSEVLSGTGVSPHLTGILKTAGLGTYTAPADEEKIVSIRRAMAAAEIAGYPADGVVLHPTDWADIELSLIVTPGGGINAALAQGGVQRTLWGLGVVSAVDITAGEFLLGGFRESVTLWQRTGIEYYLTDSHADFFISNKLVLLAELRAALAVYVPKAITHGTFAVPTP